MNIYTSTQAMPYVYMCIHKESKQYYYGYRELNVSLKRTSDIDLPLYKTSSKNIKPKFDQFDWIILAEFFNADHAYEFEQELIREHWGDPQLLNEQYRTPTEKSKFKAKKGVNKGRKNPALSIRNKTTTPWNKGLTKEDPRVASYIRPLTVERRKQNSELKREWHKHNDISGVNNPMFGVKRKLLTCQHCGRQISDANHSRWHGDKCKLAPQP